MDRTFNIVPAHFIQRERAYKIALVIFFVMLAYFAARTVREPATNIFGVIQSRSDFYDYYRAAKDIRENKDPYKFDALQEAQQSEITGTLSIENIQNIMKTMEGVGSYIYPPFFASLLMPLTYFSYSTAVLIFQMLSISSLFLFLFALQQEAQNEGVKKEMIAGILFWSLIFLARFLFENVTNGNVGFFLISLCGTGILFMFRLQRVLEFVGGFLIGLAGAIKVIPLVFGSLALAGRKWFSVAGIGTGFLIGILLPMLWLSPARTLQLNSDWWNYIGSSYSKHTYVRPWANNQTIAGAFGKLFVAGSDERQSKYGLPLPLLDQKNIRESAQPLIQGVRAVNMLLILGLILLSLYLMIRPLASGGVLQVAWFGRLTLLSSLVALVTSGVSWYHTYSMLFVPVAFLMFYLFMADDRKRREFIKKDFPFLGTLLFFTIIYPMLPVMFRDALSLYTIFGIAMTLFSFEFMVRGFLRKL